MHIQPAGPPPLHDEQLSCVAPLPTRSISAHGMFTPHTMKTAFNARKEEVSQPTYLQLPLPFALHAVLLTGNA